MPPRSVQYTAKRDEVIVGPVATSDGQHCATLRRFGQDVTPFMLSKHQRRKLNRGESITITQAAISLSSRYWGARRRKKRKR